MKYSLNPFRWLVYVYRRIKYRGTNWCKFFCPVPWNKKYAQYRIAEIIKKLEESKYE